MWRGWRIWRTVGGVEEDYNNISVRCYVKLLYMSTHGRKLHAELGRFATRVKISEMRRCWTLVSSCV